MKCTELTSDTSDELNWAHIKDSQILLSTPEKWDHITRKSVDAASLSCNISLVLIDEVHVLAENRGACLGILLKDCLSVLLRLFL